MSERLSVAEWLAAQEAASHQNDAANEPLSPFAEWLERERLAEERREHIRHECLAGRMTIAELWVLDALDRTEVMTPSELAALVQLPLEMVRAAVIRLGELGAIVVAAEPSMDEPSAPMTPEQVQAAVEQATSGQACRCGEPGAPPPDQCPAWGFTLDPDDDGMSD